MLHPVPRQAERRVDTQQAFLEAAIAVAEWASWVDHLGAKSGSSSSSGSSSKRSRMFANSSRLQLVQFKPCFLSTVGVCGAFHAALLEEKLAAAHSHDATAVARSTNASATTGLSIILSCQSITRTNSSSETGHYCWRLLLHAPRSHIQQLYWLKDSSRLHLCALTRLESSGSRNQRLSEGQASQGCHVSSTRSASTRWTALDSQFFHRKFALEHCNYAVVQRAVVQRQHTCYQATDDFRYCSCFVCMSSRLLGS